MHPSIFSRSCRRDWFLVGLLVVVIVTLASLGWKIELSIGLPPELQLAAGQSWRFEAAVPLTVTLPGGGQGPVLFIDPQEQKLRPVRIPPAAVREIVPLKAGQANLGIRLFGFIPWPQRTVQVIPRVHVVPGGQAIGVLLAPYGLIVRGLSTVIGPGGEKMSPAREAGILPGDILVRLNGLPIFSAQQLGVWVNYYGERNQTVQLEIRRDGELLSKEIRPAPSPSKAVPENPIRRDRPAYLLGVYVEEPAAGVGTLTFYEPRTGIFAALGHLVTDAATHQRQDLNEARIVGAHIAGIEKGGRGRPGEKIGTFQMSGGLSGTILLNSPYGIYGRFTHAPAQPERTVPVALAQEVHPGPATLLTVVQGDKVEEFQAEIVKVNMDNRPSGKGLIVRVTDPRLLAITGGIVQGMSGSPLLQDGMLAGAVTHVFVNDPRQGYGVLAQWMAEEAGLYHLMMEAEEVAHVSGHSQGGRSRPIRAIPAAHVRRNTPMSPAGTGGGLV
ncbi:MAG: SpoIVB peptidase [Firmicutes bacterium]|nr:SpoIVB peptidase [Bacillota bacterium]